MIHLSRCLAVLVAFALAAPSQAAPGTRPSTDTARNPFATPATPRELVLHVGQAHVLEAPGVRRIAVGNGKVVQATTLDERQVLLIPEAPGRSTLHLWNRQGVERVFTVDVLPVEAARTLGEVRALLDGTALTVRMVGDKVVVEGDPASDEQSSRLAEVAKRVPQVVNLAGRVGLEPMIGMDVRIVEIRRTVLEELGVRWNARDVAGPTFGVVGDVLRTRALRPGGMADGLPGVVAQPRVAPFGASFGLASTFLSRLSLLVQNGDAVVLAEPRLSCRSGGSARFVAGGELPIPFSTAIGGTGGVVFKEYGVKFDVSPVALAGGMIAARLATEVSSINTEVAVNNVPGLLKRRAETEVNLREMQTIVIAGLISEDASRQVDKVAGLGDIPVLGNLFRSRLFRDQTSELVVLITPYLMDDGEGRSTSAGRVVEAQALRGRAEQLRNEMRMIE